MREYPAYGRTIASHIVRGQKPVALAVLLSSRWDYYNHVPKVCIKPEEWRIGRFEFGFLRGLHAVAIVGDESSNLQLAELVLELMRVGPALLWIYDAVGGKVYDGDFASDVARWAFQIVDRGRRAGAAAVLALQDRRAGDGHGAGARGRALAARIRARRATRRPRGLGALPAAGA
jgi:hypothetical protein